MNSILNKMPYLLGNILKKGTNTMSKVDTIMEVLQKRIDAGELTLEAANEVYHQAVEKYVNEESEESEVDTPSEDVENNEVEEVEEELSIESVADFIDETRSEIHKAYFEGEINIEEAEMLLSMIDVDNIVTEASNDNDIPESSKKEVDPNAKKKQLAKKAALGAAAVGTIAGAAGLAHGIKSGKIKDLPGKAQAGAKAAKAAVTSAPKNLVAAGKAVGTGVKVAAKTTKEKLGEIKKK